MKPVTNAELRSFGRALSRLREDVGDRMDEMKEQLDDLVKRAGGKTDDPKQGKGKPDGKPKGNDPDDDGDSDDDEDSDDGFGF